MKAVFDTNVLISALNFPGSIPEEAFRLCVAGRLELVTSTPLLAEFARVLTDKFGWAPDRAERAVALVADMATIVDPKESVAVVSADPDDNRVLEAAAEGRVHLICSGDGHLLQLREWRGIRILRPTHLLEEFEST